MAGRSLARSLAQATRGSLNGIQLGRSLSHSAGQHGPDLIPRRSYGFLSCQVFNLAINQRFGISGWQAYSANKKNDDATGLCQGSTCDVRRGVELTNDARSAARISTVSAIAGVALVAGGVALYIYAPKNKEEQMTQTAVRITPDLAPERAGIAISGAW